MLSKNKRKEVVKFQLAKYRKQAGVFIAEGPKAVLDIAKEGFKAKSIFALENWLQANEKELLAEEIHVITENELQSISSLQTANQVLGIYDCPQKVEDIFNFQQQWILCLENVQDPGNMGTIIRLADWFGIEHIICSPDCVDVFNHKVIQATMASIVRVHCVGTDVFEFIKHYKKANWPLYAAVIDGENVQKIDFGKKGILVMGNESKGISENLSTLIDNGITIPKFNNSSSIDSLNVATATGIILSRIRA